MGKLVLLTGGARSGKSSCAEEMARAAQGKVLYVATAIPFDDEMKARIKKHQQQRPENWSTYEGYRDLGNLFRSLNEDYALVLLDCITILITNLIYDFLGEKMEESSSSEYAEAESYVMEQLSGMLDGINKCTSDVILVTNEVGSGIVPDNVLARHYRDIAGRVNSKIAAAADEVYLVVCGCKLKVK